MPNRLRYLGACVAAALALAASLPAALAAGSGGINAADQRGKPYLILISADGFRWDYQSDNDTPALDRIAAAGVCAESLEPVYPALTFPNHYSIATGLYPAEHGIVANEFFNEARDRKYVYKERASAQDGSWYAGEPIWTLAEKNGLVSAAFFFVGTEATIGGIAPTYWNPFDESIPGERRIRQALEWLAMPEEKRPHLITLYFEDVDRASHDFGPGSAESRAAIRRVDGYIGQLLDGIDTLDIRDEIYLIVLSDHGQLTHDEDSDVFILDEVIDLDGLSIIDGVSFLYVYLDQPDKKREKDIRDAINERWQHGRAYLRDETPKHWRVQGDKRFADITLQADPNHMVLSRRDMHYKIKPGDHGSDPRVKDMHGFFLAAGPRLPKGRTIESIRAVDIYPLMLEILGLPAPETMDIEGAVLTKLLTESTPWKMPAHPAAPLDSPGPARSNTPLATAVPAMRGEEPAPSL